MENFEFMKLLNSYKVPATKEAKKETSQVKPVETIKVDGNDKSAKPERPKKHERKVIQDSLVEPVEVDEGQKVTENPSKILFIQNLVRPFTLVQLQEVLKRSGTVIAEGFWIDKIKSKCFVTYETEEQAVKTRFLLNNAKWPPGSPKLLSVEYSTQEQMEFHKNAAVEPKPIDCSLHFVDSKDSSSLSFANRRKERYRYEHTREREEKKQPVMYTREWDQGKIPPHTPERERKMWDALSRRSSKNSKVKNGQRNHLNTSKSLDDMFMKTRTTPWIYWLPLTERQVLKRQVKHLLERREKKRKDAERQAREKRHYKESRNQTCGLPR